MEAHLKVPKIAKSAVSHYAAIARSENVVIEISVDGGFTLRISPVSSSLDDELDQELAEFERRHPPV